MATRYTITPLGYRLLDNRLTPAETAALAAALAAVAKAQQTTEAQ
jgi:hypothetical protein